MQAGVIQYVLIFVANPYLYASIYNENQGLMILAKNKTAYWKKKLEEKFQDTNRGRQRPNKDRQYNVQMKKDKRTTIYKTSHKISFRLQIWK